MPEYLSGEDLELEERQEIEPVSSSALAVLNRSEHAAMVATANMPGNRRKLDSFDSKLMAYANHSQPVALSMFYSLPRAGKQIIGPSVRFAEVVAPCWRNCAVASRVIGDADRMVTAQGVFVDYEANLRNAIEVPRRITDKNGNRFNDDMILTTSNAAMSVARRNSVLKGGVPQALWTPAYDAAQLTAVGKAASHAQRVADAMEFLHKLGVNEWQILNAVGVPSPKELETEHLLTLRVLCQEIKRGDKTIEQVFGSAFDKEIDALFVQHKMNMAQQTMLRNSYMGRAEALVEYLREKLGPASKPTEQKAPVAEKTVPVEAKPAPSVETKRYSDGTVATGVAPLPNQSPAQQAASDDKSKNRTISDDTPRNTAPWGRSSGVSRPDAPEPSDQFLTIPDDTPAIAPVEGAERTVTVATPDGGTSTATVVSGGTAAPTGAAAPREAATPIGAAMSSAVRPGTQSSMEPPPRRRAGRPTREEMARRQAAQPSMPEQDGEPEPELDARQEAERVLEQADQFSF